MANQMEDSSWFRHTPKRAQRILIERVIKTGVQVEEKRINR